MINNVFLGFWKGLPGQNLSPGPPLPETGRDWAREGGGALGEGQNPKRGVGRFEFLIVLTHLLRNTGEVGPGKSR